jgi:hypothetical protein
MANYKLFCAGEDASEQFTINTFFAYSVEGVDEARRAIRADNYNRKIIRKLDLSWRTVELPAVRCDKSGVTLPSQQQREQEILTRLREEYK